MPFTAPSTQLVFEPIPGPLLERIRSEGVDEAGNPISVRSTEEGDPLRCCLRAARRGESAMLIAYTPPGTTGAYAERGPVFVHAQQCEGYRSPGNYPPTLAHHPQVVRAYNYDGAIADGSLAEDGREALRLIEAFLSRDDVAMVHVRNVGYGCYNFAVRRQDNGRAGTA